MLFKVALTLFVTVLVIEQTCGEKRQNQWSHLPRIIGGKDADANDYPYQVSLEVNGSHNCGGAILTENFIVTAAHCVDDYPLSILSIRAGSILREVGGQVVKVSRIILHPDYNLSSFKNDIALLRLTAPLRFDESVKPIPIATSPPPTGAEVTIVGWGITADGRRADRLQYTKMNVTPARTCTFDVLCLLDKGGSTIGQSDSGGAAIYRGTLVGVASFFIRGSSTLTPAGYALVPKYVDWLKENSDL